MSEKKFLFESDALNGREGSAFIDIEGTVTHLFNFVNLNVKANVDVSDFLVVGTRKKQKKSTTIELSGSMTVYYGSATWTKIMADYIKTGKVSYFDLTVTNDDPNTTVGKQIIQVHKCQITTADIIKLDASSAALDQSVSFYALDFTVIEEFVPPTAIGTN